MRRMLLDTHALLWWLSADPRLGKYAMTAIADGADEVYVSAASAWEISIKKALGKLRASDDMDSIVQQEGFVRWDISFFHGERAGELPNILRDPFDRMLVAQAQAEGLEIVTGDLRIQQYGVKTLVAGV